MDLTVLSKNEYYNIADGNLLPEDAYCYLNENIQIRTFSETLKRYSQGLDVKKLLTKKLAEYDPSGKPDSIARKVRDWLNDKYEPSDRETFFKICFALGLDENKAMSFLQTAADGGIHYRNPLELTYAFALRTGLDYPEARKLYDSLPPLDTSCADENVYTEAVINEFRSVYTEKDFIDFYKRNMSKLGAMHNMAYKRFKIYMDCLERPDNDINNNAEIEGERHLSIDELVETYFRMNVPVEIKTSGYTYIQKVIKKYWPNAAAVKGMKNRTIDVNRKTLILLYLITEGITPADEDVYFYEEELSPEEIFGEHYDKINIMLTDCGFSPLDPRNVFDWLVMYSLKAGNSEFMTDEMQGILDKIFN